MLDPDLHSSRAARSVHRHQRSDADPLHLVELDLIASPVIQARRARRLVVGHLLRNLQLAAIQEVLGDAEDLVRP